MEEIIKWNKKYKDLISTIVIVITLCVTVGTLLFTNVPNKIAESLNKDINEKKENIVNLNNEKLSLLQVLNKKNNELNNLNLEIYKKDKEIKELFQNYSNLENDLKKIKNEKYNKILESYIPFLKKELTKFKYNSESLINYEKTISFIEENKQLTQTKHVFSIEGYYIKNKNEIFKQMEDYANKNIDNLFNNISCHSEINKKCEEIKQNKINLNYILVADLIIDSKEKTLFSDFLKNNFYKYRNQYNGEEMDNIHQDFVKILGIDILTLEIANYNLNKQKIKEIENRGLLLNKNIEKINRYLDSLYFKIKK